MPPTDHRHRFSFFCDEWLRLRKSKVRESTYIKYNTILEKYIKPKLGSCFPATITTDTVDNFAHGLLFDDNLAVKTVHDILVVLHSVLKYVAAQLPSLCAAVEINYPQKEKKEIRVLDRSEQERFVKFLLADADFCKFGVLLMLLSGIRIGELCALRWDNVNLQEKTIRISATLQRLRCMEGEDKNRTHIVIGAPKSATSIRTIPLTDYAAELCRKFAVYNAHFLKLSNRSLSSIYGNIVFRSQNTQTLYMVTVLMGNKNSTDIPLADTYAVELQ